ncbi:fatty acid desaturase family protein [Nafulsella turpanensis]|uniref:fatty acid desaturase family protein n=1 Tax=Nafulsella turpanensis TaxID=1265690 RepID=UPI000346DED8|nr:acyl-CoA desaturase [Nafulsella turpanensis]
MKSSVKFSNQVQAEFFNTLRKRVNQHFKENNITRFGNKEMIGKTIVLLVAYLGSFAAILTLNVSVWLLLPFALLMGLAMAGIGMSVMHDALHGSYSKSAAVNKFMGRSLNFLGGSSFIWNIQHNVLHHTYTNIHGLDEDIETKVIVRLCKHAPIKHFYRYQHFYVFFAYGLMTLLMLVSDFIKLFKYHRRGIVEKKNIRVSREYFKMILYKGFYLFLMIGLPLLLTGLGWWQVLIGFLIIHLTAGYILSIVFQLAHVVEGAEQPMPDNDGSMQNAWAVHQLQTTANFSRNNRFLNWYVGGLNFQIEHHLFPNICHVHYRKLSKIVQQTAEEFQLPYNLKPSFGSALQSHIRMLKILGREQPALPQ